jgi:large subunit ribosomal protein L10
VEKAQLTILRTGILSALTRGQPEDVSLRPYLNGPTALITCPSLSPAYLSKLLSAINRSVSSSKKDVPATGPAPKQPEMKLVAGILEGGRLVGGKEIERVKELPELDILRAQVVGMLEGQGRSLVGLLSQAGGGGLVRTLQGLEKGMQEEGSTSG